MNRSDEELARTGPDVTCSIRASNLRLAIASKLRNIFDTEEVMRRYLPLYFSFLLLLATTAFGQDHGRLAVTVQTQPEPPSPAGRAVGAKVIVVHWTHSQLHPQMVQDQVATTDANGTCTIDLPAGTYDLFVTATGMTPQALKREVSAGETTPFVVVLKAAATHLRPVGQP